MRRIVKRIAKELNHEGNCVDVSEGEVEDVRRGRQLGDLVDLWGLFVKVLNNKANKEGGRRIMVPFPVVMAN